MRIMVKKLIKILAISEILIVATTFISFTFFINLQVAFLSSYFVIVGSMYAYKKMVQNQLDANVIDEDRDLLDQIEDPHELYDDVDINEAPADELDLKEIVKEERAKIKTFNKDSIKHGARGSVSLFRLVPYLFLVLGFIALKNNELLSIGVYLPSLAIGIIIGNISMKTISFQ